MKIYIAGKITGLPYEKVVEKFNERSEIIRSRGHEPVSPIDVSPFKPSKEWHDYMIDCIGALLMCDGIYMISNWGQSKGARIEYQIAKELGLPIFFESESKE